MYVIRGGRERWDVDIQQKSSIVAAVSGQIHEPIQDVIRRNLLATSVTGPDYLIAALKRLYRDRLTLLEFGICMIRDQHSNTCRRSVKDTTHPTC